MTSQQFVYTTKHLPDFMRDFHDQKKLFKCIAWMMPTPDDGQGHAPIGWTDAQIYTIDKFLAFMAMHGYTLQRSRARGVDFEDIHVSMQDFEDAAIESLRAILRPEASQPSR